jgi:hypothetical protein
MNDSDHEHRWMFLTTKTSFEPWDVIDGVQRYSFTEYAYLICNGCTSVIKKKVKSRNDDEN